LDVKGSFKAVEVFQFRRNIEYSFQFLKDRIVLINIGKDYRFTGGMSYRNYFTMVVIYLLVFAIFMFVTALVKPIITINVAGATLLSLLLAFASIAIYGRKVKNKPNRSINIEELLKDKSIDEIITLNKNNREILFQDISKIEINNYKIRRGIFSREGEVFITTRNKREKFDIITNQNYENCRDIISTLLSDKLTTNHTKR
jgi:hypothetical protein